MIFKVMIINRSKSLDKSELKKSVKAVDIQLRRDFGPAWNIASSCFLFEGREKNHDATIIIEDDPHIDAAGYHDYDSDRLIPHGFVFVKIAKEMHESLSVTLSHEVLELVLNRHCNYYAIGRHPLDRRKKAAIWLEACDAVQDQTYAIDGVAVSDFLYPYYFTPDSEHQGQNNHVLDKPVESFGVTPGGYIGYFDFDKKREGTFFANQRAKERHKIKKQAGDQRRKEKVKKIIKSEIETKSMFDNKMFGFLVIMYVFLFVTLFIGTGVLIGWLFFS